MNLSFPCRPTWNTRCGSTLQVRVSSDSKNRQLLLTGWTCWADVWGKKTTVLHLYTFPASPQLSVPVNLLPLWGWGDGSYKIVQLMCAVTAIHQIYQIYLDSTMIPQQRNWWVKVLSNIEFSSLRRLSEWILVYFFKTHAYSKHGAIKQCVVNWARRVSCVLRASRSCSQVRDFHWSPANSWLPACFLLL